MRRNIEAIFKGQWGIILICLVGLVAISWFQGDYLIAAYYWFPSQGERISYFSEMLYLWHDRISLGTANFRAIVAAPYGMYLAITEMIGLSAVASQKIFFYISFVSAGLSMYYLSYVIGLRRPWRMISALFYMMNPAAIALLGTWAAYNFAPLLLGLYINGLEQRKNLRYIIFFALIWLITTTYMYVDPGYLIIHFFVILSYLIFYIISHKDSKLAIQAIKFTSTLFLIFVFLNMFWMLSLGPNLSSELEKTAVVDSSSEQIFRGLSGTMLDGLRLLGYGTSLLSTYKGDLIFQWAPWYFQMSTILISILIPFIVFLSLFSKDRGRRYFGYFGFLVVGGLFLITGANPPFGEFKFWLLGKIPYAITIFRNPLKFQILVALGYAPLLGMGISMVCRFFERRKVRGFQRIRLKPNSIRYRFWERTKGYNLVSVLFVILMCFLLFGYYSAPYWTGSIISKGGEVIPSHRIRIPDYYSDAREWLSDFKEDARILPLPMSKTYQSAYKWESGYFGTNPDRFLLDSPTITHNDGSLAYRIPLRIGKETESPKSDLSRLLGLLGVRYVMLHRDTNWEYIKGHGEFFDTDLKSLRVFIQQQSGIHLSKSFGEIDFYRLSDDYFLPHIYPASDSILINGGVDEMFQVVASDNFTVGNSILFLSNDLDQEQNQFIKEYSNTVLSFDDNTPKITFQKINPTKYKVHVNASQPFFLVFSESYHKDWVAYVNGQQIRNEYHFMANGYANAWYINKTGTYAITLEFWPQKFFYVGSAISIITLIFCVFYISKDKIKALYSWHAKKKQ